MMKFTKYVIEMARPTGEPFDSKDKDRSEEWEKVIKNEKRFISLIAKVRPGMLLYQYGNTYILTDKKDFYIAHIDIHEIDVVFNNKKKKAFSITNGNSNIRGRYIVLLLSVLENVKIDFIFSDIMLSDGAIKFYKKIIENKGPYHSFVLQYNIVKEPKKGEDYFKNNSYQIGLSKLNNHIKNMSEELDTFRKNKFNISEDIQNKNEITLLYSVNKEL